MITSESEKWVPDEETYVCQVCNIYEFDTILSRHHCRACGKARKKVHHFADSHLQFPISRWCVDHALQKRRTLKIKKSWLEYVTCAIFSVNSQVTITVRAMVKYSILHLPNGTTSHLVFYYWLTTSIVGEYVLWEDSNNENYYHKKYMITIIRFRQIRIYDCEVSIPLNDSSKHLELDFNDIDKVL